MLDNFVLCLHLYILLLMDIFACRGYWSSRAHYLDLIIKNNKLTSSFDTVAMTYIYVQLLSSSKMDELLLCFEENMLSSFYTYSFFINRCLGITILSCYWSSCNVDDTGSDIPVYTEDFCIPLFLKNSFLYSTACARFPLKICQPDEAIYWQ